MTVDHPDTIATMVKLPIPLRQWVERQAAEHDRTMSKGIIRALRAAQEAEAAGRSASA